jgi:glutathione S-transferase
MALVLHGYSPSVYARIVRLALAEKGVAYGWVEVNPFAAEIPAAYLALHPFGRVPALVHGDFTLYETSAITRYVDRAFAGPALQPDDVRALARMDQIVAVVDAYGYWPMVRQVFVQQVIRPGLGQPADAGEVARGLRDAEKVLDALEALATGQTFLVGGHLSLADLHLGAMMAYFTAAPAGQAMLDRHVKLAAWWRHLQQRPSLAATDPRLPVTQL